MKFMGLLKISPCPYKRNRSKEKIAYIIDLLILYFKNVYVDKYYNSITIYWLDMFPNIKSVFSVLRKKKKSIVKGLTCCKIN